MQNDDEQGNPTRKAETSRDSSWVYRAFNPLKSASAIKERYEKTLEDKISYVTDILQRPPAQIGESARLFQSPEVAKRSLSLVLGEVASGNLLHIIERIQELDGETLKQAARRNWFIQPETPVPFIASLTEYLDNDAAIRDAFALMMRGQIDHIRDRLRKDFPHRAEILEEAFALHGEQRYLASIPLFLTMAEGIAAENGAQSIFSPGPGKEEGQKTPKVSKWIRRQEMSRLAKIYASALQIAHPLSQGAKKGQLSRHGVLHGNSTDYGNEIFSLQAVSILGLVGWVFCKGGLVFTDHGA